jgi:hypothetical protein
MILKLIWMHIHVALSSEPIYDGEECNSCLYTDLNEVCRSSSDTLSYCCTEEEVTGVCTNDDSTDDDNDDTCTDVYDADDSLCG